MGMWGGRGKCCQLLTGLVCLFVAVCSGAQAAETCRAIFGSGLQTHGGGSVTFQWGGKLLGNPTPEIDTARVWSVQGSPACDGLDCTASGQEGRGLAGLVLPGVSAEHDLRVGYLSTAEAGGSELNRYRDIDVDAGAALSFNARHQAYHIQRLSIGHGARVTLAPGRYWIGQLEMASDSQLLVSDGTARVMLGSSLVLPFQASLNAAPDRVSRPEALQLFVRGDLSQDTNTSVEALVYVEGDYRAAFSARLSGGLNARNAVIDNAAIIRTRMDAIGTLGWNYQCLEAMDLDGDGILDPFDDDTDGDGYDDERERVAGSDWLDPQSVPQAPPPAAQVNLCTASFAKGLQSHSPSGLISFGFDAGLHDGISPYLPASRVDNSFASSTLSCGSQHCQPSHSPAPVAALPPFLESSSDFNQDLPYAGSVVLDGSRSQWHRLNVSSMATVRFSEPGEYRLRELAVGYGGVVELAPGDYWIEKLSLASEARLQPLGGGTVRLHVRNDLELPWQSRINASAAGQMQDAAQLLLLAEGNVVIGSNASLSGFVHARGDLTQQYAAQLSGGAVARNISLETQAWARQDQAALYKVDFGLLCDLDGDGIGDNQDSDRDGDGISNDYEIELGYDPDDPKSTPPDLDRDGIPDALDDDRDGDGVRNEDDAFPDDANESRDLDGDGIGDNADPDRDGDGISNDYELQLGTDPDDASSVPADQDGDGIPDALDDDRDGDGVPNDQDAFPDDPAESRDLDGDGIGDNADPDRDGDGISNDYEIQLGTDPDDAASVPADLDRDGIPDVLDDDRDGDGVPNDQDAFPDDPTESRDLDGDGIGDNADPDRDGDGIANDDEIQLGTDPDDASSVPADQDGDGIPDALDDDRDGDGVANDQDAFPDDPSESHDLDGDGIGDNADPDRDGDGIANDYETQLGTDPDDASSVPADQDGDGIPDALDDDRDGDGVPNDQDAFPDDPSESRDLDGDGIGDNADPDRDGDGIANDYELQLGTDPDDASSVPADQDGDGIPDALDDDRDGDGVLNEQDAFPDDPAESRDLDGDGIGDNADPDRDGDGIANDDEIQLGTDPDDASSVPADQDGDGIPDALDDDRDGDGVANDQDAFPDDPAESHDLDGDGIGDNADPDRDGDGIANDYETQLGTDPDDAASVPADQDGDGIPDALDDDRDGDGVHNEDDAFPDDPTESRDLDGDGIGDNADPDRDGDGVPNAQDAFPDDPMESRDLDGDGIGDNADPDRDGDGISNDYEIQLGTDPDDASSVPADQDGDGIPDALDDDRDGDGVHNEDDAFPDDPTEIRDLDGDGIGDNADPDRDGDGIANDYETQLGTDPDDASSVPADLDRDGIPDALDDDRDGDGVANDQDAFPDDPSESRDLDGDGVGDNADPDRDGDGIANDYEIQLGTDPDDASSVPADQDGDGIPDALDDDRDGDGVANEQDAFPDDPSESRDLDGDGIGDNADPDRDGDGISNELEIQLGTDPDDAASVPADQDKDGIPDALDDDRDGDGVLNDEDAFPDDPTESRDLDGDGIGDNTDPDRDGDGVSNDDELAAGTDPDDASDFPDRQPPQLQVEGPEVISVAEDSVTLRGTARDDESGMARLEVTSDRFPGTRFAVTLEGDLWIASVPVLEGSNRLTISAIDKAGNQSQVNRSVERQALASDIELLIDYPLAGATLTDAGLVVRGKLRSDSPAQRLEVLVNGQAAPVSATEQVTLFAFQAPALTLQPGSNSLVIQAWVDQRSIQRSLVVTYQPPQTRFEPPRFDNLSPADGSQLPGSGFVLTGQVYAEAGLEQLSLDGRTLVLREAGVQLHDLREALSVVADQQQLSVELLARDRSGQQSRQTLSWSLDREAPQILLDRPLVELPAVNRVSEQPYPLSGTLREANPASFQIDGQDVALQPGAQPGEFRFSSRLAMPVGQTVNVSLQARDQAGNQTRGEYSLALSAQAAVSWVIPTEGTELLNLGEPIALQVAARIDDLSGQLLPRAMLLSSSGELLADAVLGGDTSLKSATLQIPPQSGQYNLLAVLQDATGKVVVQSSRGISLVTPEQVPVALERIDPAAGEHAAEPNQFISLYFNQAIDLSKLELKVFETAHGKSYVDLDGLGTSELSAQGYQLVQVNRNHQPVQGRLSELPGGQVVAFYPQADLAYDAEISVEVRYDGQELERIRYRTRSLPTFVSGVVLDQLQQPVANLEVRLDGLNRSVRTNQDGAFNFGFGDSAEQNIPGGHYQLQLNPGQGNRSYGSDSRSITVQGGERNDLGQLQLAQLNGSLPFVPLAGGSRANLLQGELLLDLSSARLLFPDGRDAGDAHVQMLQFNELPYPVEPLAMPYWMYALQPSGIGVQGNFSVDLAALRIGDSLDYLPPEGTYVVMVGLDRQAARIVPVGVGRIENFRIRSQGVLAQDSLDLLGFALSGPETQAALQAYANGETNLRQLQAELHRLNKSR